jgi:phytoene synthase
VIPLETSYELCRKLARKRAKNFYYSFILLPREQHKAICAVYAFMRHCDDLADDAGASLQRLAAWKRELEKVLAGGEGTHFCWPALLDSMRRFSIPPDYFFEMIEGVSSDLAPRQIQDFSELYDYCYHVSSVVGLTVTHIFGFQDPRALTLAERCGIAFQLTNILRDIKEDYLQGRIYLPAEDLARFGIQPKELMQGGPQMDVLIRFECARARQYYQAGYELVNLVSRHSRAALWTLVEIYKRVLDRVEREASGVLVRRPSLSVAEKLLVVARAVARQRQLSANSANSADDSPADLSQGDSLQ